jgi:ABC-type nickel/cobalt efflux system permease component RcnA
MAFSHAELLLVGTVAAVGILHTIVPDHWVPITLIARQRGWSKAQTARAALLAGTGHVLSTLAIAVVVWVAGVAAAKTLGSLVGTLTSLALIGFGLWIAISALLEIRRGGHGHSHGHSHAHDRGVGGLVGRSTLHGPELQRIETPGGAVDLSIFEDGAPPRFRLSGGHFDGASAVTIRPDGGRQTFAFATQGAFWQSVDEIPEPHGFDVELILRHDGRDETFRTAFSEHDHGPHGHGDHAHGAEPPKTGSRTALLLILGSSPMVEGIPAFFAAGRYGPSLIVLMSLVFGLTTIITYIVLCVGSVAGLKRVSFGPLEKYGEVVSGAFIALVGVVFWIWPVL